MLTAAPLLIPLLGMLLSLALWRRPTAQRYTALFTTAAGLAAALALLGQTLRGGVQTLQVGNWPAPFGVTLAVDLFGAIMLSVSGLVGLCVAVFAVQAMDRARVSGGFYMLFHALLLGVNGAFSTGDIFNLYVWFEVMLMASFVLLALGGERAQLEGSIKYVILNFMASALFLTATGLLYGLTGTLNLADLALRLPQVEARGLVTALAMMYLIAFGIKAAVFPLFFWLPASYHTPPVVVTALFSGLLTKVGVYAMIRLFTLVFTGEAAFINTLLLVVAGLTMVVGVLGAAAQWDLRRLLSFHIISQIGYLVMGLGLASQGGLAGAIYFMVHVVMAKTALFFVAGILDRIQGGFDLKQLGGVFKARPWIAALFAVPALALAGLPPFSGFFAKLMLVKAGFEGGQFGVVAVSLAVSLLTLYSMSKVWQEAFWKPAPADSPLPLQRVSAWLWAPALLLAGGGLAMGLLAGPLVDLSNLAAAQLLDRAAYITAVLGGVR